METDAPLRPASTAGCVDRLLHIAARMLDRMTAARVRLLRYRLVAQPVLPKPLARPPSGSTRIMEVYAGDELLAQLPRPESVIRDRFSQGARCFVATRCGRAAACIWLAHGQYREDEVRCVFRLPSSGEAVWDFDVYVAEEHRGTRLFVQMWDAVNDALRSQGCAWSASRISAFNEASLAAHRRFGLRPLGTLNFLLAGPLQLMVSAIRPYVHLSLSSASEPTIDLSAALLAVRAASCDPAALPDQPRKST